MYRMFLQTVVTTLVVVPSLFAELLLLHEAESLAVQTSYDARVRHFEKRSTTWEKRNAIANYLPSLSYGFEYTQIDKAIVDAANESFDGFANMGQLPLLLGVLGQQHDLGDTLNQAFDAMRAAGMNAAPAGEDPFAASRVYPATFKHSVTLSQPITNGGVEIVAIGIAKETQRARDLAHEAGRLETIYNTRKAYFDALAARRVELVAEQTLGWTKQNLESSHIRHEAGAAPITDLLQWQADDAQKENDLLTARAAAEFMILNLYQSMGVSEAMANTNVTLQPLDVFEEWHEKGPVETNGSVARNPQLASIQAFTRVAEGSKKVAVTQFLPKINTFFAYSWPQYIDDDGSLVLREEQRGWTAGVQANVPIFSGLRNSTNLKKTQQEYHKAVVQEQQAENQLAVNLRRIGLFYKASHEGVYAAKKQHKLMQKQLAIMQQRYDGGQVNQLQLLEVELGARQAQIGYIHKLFECLLLETEYKMNTGALEVAQ